MLSKGSLPILEYDSDPGAVLLPNPSGEKFLPIKCAYAFLGDYVGDYAAAHSLEVVGEYRSMMRLSRVYAARAGGVPITVCEAPLGAPAAVAVLDWLISRGVGEVVAIGGCGVLADLPENSIYIPTSAVRDEGTSYHYLPPEREITLDPDVARSLKGTLSRLGMDCGYVKTWTTDGIYRETKAKVSLRRSEGCSVVEMECAAMAACCRLRGARFGQILFAQDSLADLDRHDARDWGAESFGTAMGLAVAAVSELRHG